MTLTKEQIDAVKLKVRLSESESSRNERRKNLNREMNNRSPLEEQLAYEKYKDISQKLYQACSIINPTSLEYDTTDNKFKGRVYLDQEQKKLYNPIDRITYGHSEYLDMQYSLGQMDARDGNISVQEFMNFSNSVKKVKEKLKKGGIRLDIITSLESFNMAKKDLEEENFIQKEYAYIDDNNNLIQPIADSFIKKKKY